MKILVDTRQQAGKHEKTHNGLKELGCDLIFTALPYGDYMDADNPGISVDTKQNLGEIYSNVISDHARFRRECEKAPGKLIILDESGDCDCLENVHKWRNPRLIRWYQNKAYGRRVSKIPPVSSKRLQGIMETMAEKYSVRWEFCKPEESAQRIIDLLQNKEAEG